MNACSMCFELNRSLLSWNRQSWIERLSVWVLIMASLALLHFRLRLEVLIWCIVYSSSNDTLLSGLYCCGLMLALPILTSWLCWRIATDLLLLWCTIFARRPLILAWVSHQVGGMSKSSSSMSSVMCGCTADINTWEWLTCSTNTISTQAINLCFPYNILWYCVGCKPHGVVCH